MMKMLIKCFMLLFLITMFVPNAQGAYHFQPYIIQSLIVLLIPIIVIYKFIKMILNYKNV